MFCGWEGKRHHWLIARKNSLLKCHLLIIGISIDCFLGGFQVVCFYRGCSSNFEKLFGLIFSQESWFTFVGSAVAFEKKLFSLLFS